MFLCPKQSLILVKLVFLSVSLLIGIPTVESILPMMIKLFSYVHYIPYVRSAPPYYSQLIAAHFWYKVSNTLSEIAFLRNMPLKKMVCDDLTET